MKNPPTAPSDSAIRQPRNLPAAGDCARAAIARVQAGARYSDPLDYARHPYDSMKRFAQLLALSYDMVRTRHSY